MTAFRRLCAPLLLSLTLGASGSAGAAERPSSVPQGGRISPPVGMTVSYTPCPAFKWAGGCAYTDPLRATGGVCENPRGCVYLKTRDPFTVAHELGHVWDAQHLTEPDRRWFTWALGFPEGTPWGFEFNGGRSPGELFANAYATCALGDAHYDWLARARPEWVQWVGVSRSRLRAVCFAIMVRRTLPPEMSAV